MATYDHLLNISSGHELLQAVKDYSLESPGMLEFVVGREQEHLLGLLIGKQIKKESLIRLLSISFQQNSKKIIDYIFSRFTTAQLQPLFQEIYSSPQHRHILLHRHLYSRLPFLEIMIAVLEKEAAKKESAQRLAAAEKRQRLLQLVVRNDDAAYLSYLNDVANIYDPAVMTAAIRSGASNCKKKLLEYGAEDQPYEQLLQKIE